MYLKRMARNYTDNEPEPCAYGMKLSEVLDADLADGGDEPDDLDEISEITSKLTKQIRWLSVDPGRQYIGEGVLGLTQKVLFIPKREIGKREPTGTWPCSNRPRPSSSLVVTGSLATEKIRLISRNSATNRLVTVST